MRVAVLIPLLAALALPAAARQDPAPKAPAVKIEPLVRPARTVDQCRATCDRDYFFCLAESDESLCAPLWTTCRLACAKDPTHNLPP